MNEEIKQVQGTIENEEVILVWPYQVDSTTTSSSTSSFISDEIDNLEKYMKFVKTPSQTRIFWPSPYYQSLKYRGEQDPNFWKEVATAFLDKKKNTDIARNGCQIPMYQGGPPHEPYFITIDNRDQIIIGPSKKIIATHVVGELEVLIWFMWTWILKTGYCYDRDHKDVAWTRVKSMMSTIGCTEVVSVSASCSRCYSLTKFSLFRHSFLMF